MIFNLFETRAPQLGELANCGQSSARVAIIAYQIMQQINQRDQRNKCSLLMPVNQNLQLWPQAAKYKIFLRNNKA